MTTADSLPFAAAVGGEPRVGESRCVAGDDRPVRAAGDRCSGRRAVRRGVRAGQRGADELAQWLPAACVRHAGQHGGAADSEAAGRLVLAGVSACAAFAGGAPLVSVVATCYLLGVSARWVEKLAQSLGLTQLSKSQMNEMAKTLDARVAELRNRPLDGSLYTFVWVDALMQKVGEGGRVANGACLAEVRSIARATARFSEWR